MRISQTNLQRIHKVARRARSLRRRGRLDEAMEICDLVIDEFEGHYGLTFAPLQPLLFEVSKIYERKDLHARADEFRERALWLLERMLAEKPRDAI